LDVRRRQSITGPAEFWNESSVDRSEDEAHDRSHSFPKEHPEGEGEIMPARPSHIPHNLERTTLQKMSATRGLLSAQLYPAGKETIAGMLAKGWIEMCSDGRGGTGYSITSAAKRH
jgi:hypothetical protein